MHEGIEDFHVPEVDVVDHACELLRILSDPTRFRLLYALSQGESNVACLAEIVGANPTAVSQHLSKLRLAGIVKARRQGTFMYYTVVDPTLYDIMNAVLDKPNAASGTSRALDRATVTAAG